MMSRRYLYFRPQKANLGFGYSNLTETNKTIIYLEGFANMESFVDSKRGGIHVYEVGAEHKFKDIINPIEEYKNEITVRYGQAILFKPDNDIIKEDFIEIELYLKPKDFEQLKYLVDRSFFPSNAEMSISLSIVGMELGFDPELDKFPPEKSLPIIGYRFGITSNKNTNLTARDHSDSDNGVG